MIFLAFLTTLIFQTKIEFDQMFFFKIHLWANVRTPVRTKSNIEEGIIRHFKNNHDIKKL